MTVFLFLGIDGGGSKTEAVVVDEQMTTLGHGRAGPSNHLRVGIREASGNLGIAIHDAVRSAGLTTLDIRYAYGGIAGNDHPRHRQKIIEALRVFFPKQNFTVDTDARIALTAGIGSGVGIVIISGTGSVAYGRNRDNREARAGGWGPTIGDEGSGYAIARDGLSAVARAWDGRGPSTILTELICTRHDMCEPQDLPYFVYAPSTHADDIAEYCRLVVEAASKGDQVAIEILEREAEELGITVLAVARELDLLAEEFPVAWVGGAFNAGELLLGPLRTTIRKEAPDAILGPAIEAPVLGAARMAIGAAAQPRTGREP
ncbi:MAG TPA: BadF/BadG/BcrA/BcrD ATPase family protein [Thermoanaerobaculia bacterium]|nr:BadF/BadG/BcrA/BcrD ATPase family protein [Thermoanaerobaculia bacterium]